LSALGPFRVLLENTKLGSISFKSDIEQCRQVLCRVSGSRVECISGGIRISVA